MAAVVASNVVSYSARSAGITVDMQDPGATAGATAGGETDTMSSVQRVIGGDGNDVITGTSGDDIIDGGGGNDTLNGLDGNNLFPQGSANDGNDNIHGGNGNNVVDYSARTTPVAATTGSSLGNGDVGTGESDTFVAITGLNGGSGNDTLTGDAGKNVLEGGAGDDVIDGLGNDDTLSGGDGDDSFPMGSAVDGNDSVTGGAGTDTVDYTTRTSSSDITIDETQLARRWCSGRRRERLDRRRC